MTEVQGGRYRLGHRAATACISEAEKDGSEETIGVVRALGDRSWCDLRAPFTFYFRY